MQNKKSRDNIAIIPIEARRKQVASYLQHSLTKTEIAQCLGVDVSTVSRDIRALKEQATNFVYDLAKQDLAYFYSSTIDDIAKARQEAWTIYNKCNQTETPNIDTIFEKPNPHNNRD